jgi:hypothetical protein
MRLRQRINGSPSYGQLVGSNKYPNLLLETVDVSTGGGVDAPLAGFKGLDVSSYVSC